MTFNNTPADREAYTGSFVGIATVESLENCKDSV
jgi:hypothetical protein